MSFFSSFHIFSHLGDIDEGAGSTHDGWILETSKWDDTGIWIDVETWRN